MSLMMYGEWHIDESLTIYSPKYTFWHDSFDGAPDAYDNRYGYGDTIEECMEMINEMESE